METLNYIKIEIYRQTLSNQKHFPNGNEFRLGTLVGANPLSASPVHAVTFAKAAIPPSSASTVFGAMSKAALAEQKYNNANKLIDPTRKNRHFENASALLVVSILDTYPGIYNRTDDEHFTRDVINSLPELIEGGYLDMIDAFFGGDDSIPSEEGNEQHSL